MSLDEFWFGDPALAIYYRKAEKLRWERFSREAWLQGAYINDALAVVIGNAFGGKGSKKLKYPEEPYELFKPEKSEEEEKAHEIRLATMERLKQVVMSKHGRAENQRQP